MDDVFNMSIFICHAETFLLCKTSNITEGHEGGEKSCTFLTKRIKQTKHSSNKSF